MLLDSIRRSCLMAVLYLVATASQKAVYHYIQLSQYMVNFKVEQFLLYGRYVTVSR